MQQQNVFHSSLTVEEVELLYHFRTMSKASRENLANIAKAFSEEFPDSAPIFRLVKTPKP